LRHGRFTNAIARQRDTRVPFAWFTALCSLVLALTCLTAFAQTEQRFEIRSAYVEPAEGVYLLNATLVFELPEGAREAIREGAPLSFDLDIVLHRSRRYWLDETVASLQQRYELVYHALSERYLLRNLNSGEQVSFATLDVALDSLRVLSNLPIIDQSLIVPDARHEISLRAHLDVRTMPDALRFIVFWARDWRQNTEWYIWSPQS
jgi:Domain of unknown function (DUF4390)